MKRVCSIKVRRVLSSSCFEELDITCQLEDAKLMRGQSDFVDHFSPLLAPTVSKLVYRAMY